VILSSAFPLESPTPAEQTAAPTDLSGERLQQPPYRAQRIAWRPQAHREISTVEGLVTMYLLNRFLNLFTGDRIRLQDRDYERVGLVLQTGGLWTRS